MNALRAAVVAHSSVRGGAEKYLRDLYSRDAFEGELYGSQPDWPAHADLRLSPKWGGRRSLIEGRLRLRGERARLRSSLDASRHDFAHVQFKREQIGFTQALGESLPVIWTEHGMMSPTTQKLIGRAYASAAGQSSLIICVSEEVAARVAAQNKDARIVVIENSVDTIVHTIPTSEQRRAAREALGIADDRKLAAWVGRMEEHKRPDLAARIGYEWNGDLLIAGDGPERASIVDAEGVRAIGHIDPVDLYRAADVLLMTSDGVGEGLPYVLLEAAAYGLPAVVSSEVPIFSRLAAVSGGVAVSGLELTSWRRALDEVIENPERGSRARSWAEAHDLRVWEKQHDDAIRSVL